MLKMFDTSCILAASLAKQESPASQKTESQAWSCNIQPREIAFSKIPFFTKLNYLYLPLILSFSVWHANSLV